MIENSSISKEQEETELGFILSRLRSAALNFIGENSQEWLVASLKRARSIDDLVSTMRHVDGGQIYILSCLQEINPNIKWQRGGTLKRWGDVIGEAQRSYYSQEDLDTFIIDGGRNGVLGRERLARSYSEKITRENPVLYELSMSALIEGLRNDQISITSEHDYDLVIGLNKQGDSKKWLEFCRNHLIIENIQTIRS